MSDQEHGDQKAKRSSSRKGGMKTMPFILANDMGEKLAMVGIARNMVNYFTKQMHMPLSKAANTVTNFNGTSNLTPLMGAFLADSYTGKFLTIASGSIIYLLGMICLTLSASLRKLRPPKCGDEVCREASSGQLALLYLSLLLTAIGAGGMKPCVAAYGAEQFIEEDPRHAKKTGVYFIWYYFATGAATLLASTVLVYVQDNAGWGLGIAIPTIIMAFSIVLFVVGYPIYRNLDPSGSPYVRLVQVFVAAFRKRKIMPVPDLKLLYVDAELDSSISTDGMLSHSEQMKFLDKAAIVTEPERNLKQSTKPDLWRLSTVHRVEEVKLVMRMLPIWGSGILFITSAVQQNTFSLQQANTMERQLTPSFQIPAASMSVFVELSLLSTLALYDRVLVPLGRRYTGLHRGINCLHRMTIGLFMSTMATLVAGFIEVRRKQVAADAGLTGVTGAAIPISAFWLVPQYSLHGIAEAFFLVGRLEFFYDQAPESMRSTTSALHFLSVALGNYGSTVLVTLLDNCRPKWLPPHNLNKGKLENFYWLLTFLQGVNFLYYVLCAKMYTFKSLEARRSAEQKGQVTHVDLELSAL